MAAISLRGISKTYDNGFQAVRSIDLDIADQEFMVLVGPSGCGTMAPDLRSVCK
jgi:ABC-type Fe3+/spermidine/putrescine transport system ATPase subunit